MSETVPLLGTAAGGTVSGTSGLVAGAGAIAGGLAAGGITASVVNRIKEKGAVLPGTDYVGPGNSISIDAPRHESDAIAKDHDVGYQEAVRTATAHSTDALRGSQFETFKNTIRNLDESAIQKFKAHWDRDGKWQSLVGRWGLEAKQFLEDIFGHTLYPQFPGKCGLLSPLPMNVIIGIF